MVTHTSNGVSATDGAPSPAVMELPLENGRNGRSNAAVVVEHGARPRGRVRTPAEIERARKSAAFTRQVNKDPSIIRQCALLALQDSDGKGPAMAIALANRIEEHHGVRFAQPAVRTMLLRLKRKGVLTARKVGTAYEWSAGDGKPGRRGGKPAAKVPAASRARRFRGTEAADRLIAGLTQALEAAHELREELSAVASLREQLAEVLKALKDA